MKDLGDAIGSLEAFEVKGDHRVTLEADLDKTAALVFVPIRQARENVRRTQCVNNLKQIGLAMHNYHAANNTFPPAYTAAKDGKPLLSWRVLILPPIPSRRSCSTSSTSTSPGTARTTSPSSPGCPKTTPAPSANKALAGEGKTSYLTPRGPGTIFPGAQGIKLQDITDGTSNTILVVEANDVSAVIWTKPDDWERLAPTPRCRGLWVIIPTGRTSDSPTARSGSSRRRSHPRSCSCC